MKVSRSLQAQWDRHHRLEVKLRQEVEAKRELVKKAAKKEIELVLYEMRLQKLYLIKHAQIGKNIDREI